MYLQLYITVGAALCCINCSDPETFTVLDVERFNVVNNQQDATTFSFINLFNSALHVSGDKFTHPQEHFLTVQLLVQCTDSAAARCIVPKAVYTVKKCS